MSIAVYYINRKVDRRPLNFEIDFPVGHRFYHLTHSLIILTVSLLLIATIRRGFGGYFKITIEECGFNAEEKISSHSFFESLNLRKTSILFVLV